MERLRHNIQKVIFRLSIWILLPGISLNCFQEYPDSPLFALAGAGGLNGFTLTVNVSGLQDPGLVLANGTATLNLSTSGSSTFSQSFDAGSNYSVVIQARPAGYICNISNASGVFTDNVSDVQVDCLRAAIITPVDNGVLQSTQSVRLVFTKSMTGCTPDPAATPLANNLAGDVTAVNLVTTNVANDTVEFTTAGWTGGPFQFLNLINCNAADGSVSMNLIISYFVASNVVYVSTTGTDVGTCTNPSTPCQTIPYGIGQLPAAACAGLQDCAVLVAEGPVAATPYGRQIYDTGGAAILVQDGISLLGSFTPDFSNRFTGARNSIIAGNGGPCTLGNCSIVVPAAVSASTLIEGFTIYGDESGGADSTGIEVNGGVVLANNHIMGGNGTNSKQALNFQGVGVRVATGNRIETTGNGSVSARGIIISGGASQIYRNQITLGGAAGSAQAILLQGGAGSIHTNGIYTGISGSTWGIRYNTNTAYDIYNNLILADQATAGVSTGIQLVLNVGGASIFNNIIIGNLGSVQSFCLRESAALPASTSIDSNNLFVCPDGLMQDAGGVAYDTICNAGAPATAGTFGNATCAMVYPNGNSINNVSLDPLFLNGPAGDFRYSANSPCTSAQGGVDPTTYGALILPDVDFQARPGADGQFSIGPYEPTFGCL